MTTTEHGDRRIALNNEILRTTVGSGVHGIAIEGTDDHDELGIYIEPKANVYGLTPPADHYVHRTQPEGHRSGPGDTDLVCYSLRKYLALAVKGNPTALLPLFAPAEHVLATSQLGEELREMRTLFLSQEAVSRFLGYMHQQHERMLTGKKVPNRPELIEKYGYDVKYASHALRLALQGHEVCKYGHLTLPMPGLKRSLILSVKQGQYAKDYVSGLISKYEAEISRMLRTGECQLPLQPHMPTIRAFSIRAHETFWKARR